jgi:hypothetical protein
MSSTPNRYGSPPGLPEELPSTADLFAAWAGDRLLHAPTEQTAEAVDAPLALGDVDAAAVLDRLYPGRAARQAAEEDRAANPARFGAWAAERFAPSTESPEAADLAAYFNCPHTH